MKYLAVLERAPHNYSAFVPDVPGAVGIGNSREKALDSLAQGLALQLHDLCEAGEDLPVPTTCDQLDVSEYEPEEPFEVVEVEAASMNPVSLTLEQAILAAGITKAELARRMGTTASVISRLTDPFYFGHSSDSLERAARALGIELVVTYNKRRNNRRKTDRNNREPQVQAF